MKIRKRISAFGAAFGIMMSMSVVNVNAYDEARSSYDTFVSKRYTSTKSEQSNSESYLTKVQKAPEPILPLQFQVIEYIKLIQ